MKELAVSSMFPASEDLERVVAPTDRQPELCVEALSRRIRVGLLLTSLVSIAACTLAVLAMAIWPEGVLDVGQLIGIEFVVLSLALTFFMLVVFGTLVANNPRLSSWQRVSWYACFLSCGPFMLPAYWLVHVRDAGYRPALRVG